MRLRLLALVVLSIALGSCPRTPQPGGAATTTCGFSPNQTTNGLSMTCTINGPLPNLRLDPFVSGNAPCGLNSWSVFNQQVNTPMVAIYGANGDDSPARVRVNVTLGPGTHTGTMAKDNPTDNCNTTLGPQFAINTSFAGSHVALVDKGRTPLCVFQSRLTLSTFDQTLTAGVPVNISGMTRTSTQESLQRRIDLEVARAVNGLLSPSSLPLSNQAVSRSGRCENDWQPFTGN